MGLLVFEVLFNQQSRFTVGVVDFVEIEYEYNKSSYIMIIIKINDNSVLILRVFRLWFLWYFGILYI